MQTSNIVNTVVDEANRRTYVILAPRVLTDGEIYRAIRQEILRRGGKPLAQGETLTLTLTASGGTIASATKAESQNGSPSTAVSNPDEAEHFNSSPGPLG
jgi:hypothetical protein